LAAVLLAAYVLFCWHHAAVLPGGSDSSGYFNMAQHLRDGELSVPARTIAGAPMAPDSPYAYVPLGFRPGREPATLALTYPIGLPLFYAGASSLFGWETGPKLVMVLHLLAGAILTYLLGRQVGLSRGAAQIAALALAVSPLYIFLGLQAMSDVPAVVWCATTLWCAGRVSKRSALAAGAALGIAVLIRPTNALIVLPVALALGLAWRRWLALGLGGLPFAILLLVYNRAAYGSALETGYGDLGTLLEIKWLGPVLLSYARWLPVLLSPLLLGLFALPWTAAARTRGVAVHATTASVVLGFYAFYFHTQEAWWYQRFVLPAGPSLLVLALLAAQNLWQRLPNAKWATATAALAALLVLGNGIGWARHLGVLLIVKEERTYGRATALVREMIPANAVVVAMQTSGALFHGTNHLLLRWDMLDGHWSRYRDAALAAGRPIYAVFFDFERAQAFQERIPGAWRQLHSEHNLTLWRLEPTSTP